MRTILVLCTGNAARSVMAGAALAARLPDFDIVTAGTLSVDGQPMSWRTRDALRGVGLEIPPHSSRQALGRDLDDADLVIGLAPEHVEWVRRQHPASADRTVTLKRLVRDLPADESPLTHRIAALELATVELADWEEVADPGGGDAETFLACAREVTALVDELAPALRDTRG